MNVEQNNKKSVLSQGSHTIMPHFPYTTIPPEISK